LLDLVGMGSQELPRRRWLGRGHSTRAGARPPGDTRRDACGAPMVRAHRPRRRHPLEDVVAGQTSPSSSPPSSRTRASSCRATRASLTSRLRSARRRSCSSRRSSRSASAWRPRV